jgi:hypothetical protein
MSAPPATTAPDAGPLRPCSLLFREQTGEMLAVWAAIAALNFITQIVLRRELAPGEFGTLNTALGVVGLMTVPVLAMNHAVVSYLAHPPKSAASTHLNSLRAVSLLVMETFAWIWGGISVLVILAVVPLLELPRFSLELLALIIVLLAVGGLVSGAICRSRSQLRLWMWLLLAAALARLLLAAGLGSAMPWAESGLSAWLLAGFITLIPVLRQQGSDAFLRFKACQALLNREFLIYFGATLSVFLAVFLFTSADRLVAQSWFGVATNNNLGLVDWREFDAYQTAGLLGRGLLWGTQPLLWIFFAQRSRLDRTRAASLTFFWIYLGALLVGAVILGELSRPLSQLFCGAAFESTAFLIPHFAAAMVPLGLLQVLGFFALASRRYPECFVIGGLGVGYALLLYLVGRQPLLMPAYMFGGGAVAILMVLLVGVVRWGRRQP